jgi:hypothetical protein
MKTRNVAFTLPERPILPGDLPGDPSSTALPQR